MSSPTPPAWLPTNMRAYWIHNYADRKEAAELRCEEDLPINEDDLDDNSIVEEKEQDPPSDNGEKEEPKEGKNMVNF